MRVGILGGGQLARMLAEAGHPLGLSFSVLTPKGDAPAKPVSDLVVADYTDVDALDHLAETCDVVTYEFENVPVDAVAHLTSRGCPVHPSRAALEESSDRLREKDLFRRLDIPTVPYRAVDDADGLERAVADVGLPAVLKTRRFGYDGRGQRVLRSPADVEGAFTGLGGRPLILEGFCDFVRELSIVAVRGGGGETAFYPLVDNRHEGGILRTTRAPAVGVTAEQTQAAQGYAKALLEALGYVGTIALELFEEPDGSLRANEMAPRVHNSGHWSIEGAVCSQFENHLRAVCGLPLGDTAAREPTAMVNLIGEVPATAEVLAVPGAHLHLYGKSAAPGRKLGHVTVTAPSEAELEARLSRL